MKKNPSSLSANYCACLKFYLAHDKNRLRRGNNLEWFACHSPLRKVQSIPFFGILIFFLEMGGFFEALEFNYTDIRNFLMTLTIYVFSYSKLHQNLAWLVPPIVNLLWKTPNLLVFWVICIPMIMYPCDNLPAPTLIVSFSKFWLDYPRGFNSSSYFRG